MERTKPTVIAIIVAAGRGSRFGGSLPKQYASLSGRTVLQRTMEVFVAHPDIDQVLPVIHRDDSALFERSVEGLVSEKLVSCQFGGSTRQASVRNGLERVAISGNAKDIVLIHDAARPFVTADLISRAISAANLHGAAIPGVLISDTMVQTKDNQRSAPLDRQSMRAIQTPQAFQLDSILRAHRDAASRGEEDHTDDGSVASAAGYPVHVFEGDSANMKLTTQSDMALAQLRLQGSTTMVSRTATGFDVHAFGPGDHVWLCGVKIPHSSGFIAHSDGDVALHALTDALLGAMADGDIGRHFPPTDPQWKGASSDQFLVYAAKRLQERRGVIDLLDLTIICEAPKIGPHSEAMRARIAAIAGVPVSAVSVKATTTERLGFTGRKEGVSALATATIRLPLSGA